MAEVEECTEASYWKFSRLYGENSVQIRLCKDNKTVSTGLDNDQIILNWNMQQNLTHLTQTFRGPTLYADQNMQEKKTKIERNVTK